MGTRTLEYNTAAARLGSPANRNVQDGQDSRRAYDAGGSSRRQAAATLTRHSPGRWSQKGANAPLLSGWARGPNSRLISVAGMEGRSKPKESREWRGCQIVGPDTGKEGQRGRDVNPPGGR